MFKDTIQAVRRLSRSVSKNISKISDYIAVIGPSRIKSFRAALLAHDEELALNLYQAQEKGCSLIDDLPPSQPFPLRLYSDQTPLHLAVEAGMIRLVELLLERGGNPNTKNANGETCVHAVCRHSESPEARVRLLQMLLDWKGPAEIDSNTVETVSINHVDNDGHSAIHHAALNGLIGCLELLLNHGAITSLVNKDNKTCCELADDGHHSALADMIELSLIYQPQEDFLQAYHRENNAADAAQPPIFLMDTLTMDHTLHMPIYLELTVDNIMTQLKVPDTIAEILLDANEWDESKILAMFRQNRDTVFDNAKIASPYATPEKTQPSRTSLMIKDIQDSLQSIISIVKPLEETVDLDSIKLAEEEPSPELCSICSDPMESPIELRHILTSQSPVADSMKLEAPCHHAFCFSCWKQFYSIEVREGRGEVIRCPGFKCNHTLGSGWCRLLLDDEELLHRRAVQRYDSVVDRSALMRRCPVDGCGLTILAADQAHRKHANKTDSSLLPQTVLCQNGHASCLLCTMEGHAPCKCALYKCWKDRVDTELRHSGVNENQRGDDIANAMWLAANTKPCPRCGSVIEKDEGCNHMTCRRCRHDFCWICMQPWSLHSARTGGFFQCNRFADGDSANGATEGGLRSSGPNAEAMYDNTGNAHLEAARQRETANRAARFIHHFTRFKAHGDSAVLEAKMSIEALRRVQNILSRSIHAEDGDIQLNDAEYLASQGVSLQYSESKASLIPQKTKRGSFDILEELSRTPILWLLKHSSFTPGQHFDVVTVYPRPMRILREHLMHAEAVERVSIEFLRLGFEELLKCRHFLKNSYSYAFYSFGERNEFDLEFRMHGREVFESLLHLLTQKRILLTRKREFEHLQTELESMTELLSNLVARRRLRASDAQITMATEAARVKRLEFENLLLVWHLHEEQEVEAARARQSSRKAMHRPTSSLLDRFRTGSDSLLGQRRPNRSLASLPRTSGGFLQSSPLSNPVDREEDLLPGSDMSRLLAALHSVLEMDAVDSRRPGEGSTRSQHVTPPPERVTRDPEDEGDTGEQLDTDDELLLAFRLEEEEQINKAILESLNDAPESVQVAPRETNRMTWRRRSGARAGRTTEASYHNKIESLTALGFTRVQAVNALAYCNNDIDAAANYLMTAADDVPTTSF